MSHAQCVGLDRPETPVMTIPQVCVFGNLRRETTVPPKHTKTAIFNFATKERTQPFLFAHFSITLSI